MSYKTIVRALAIAVGVACFVTLAKSEPIADQVQQRRDQVRASAALSRSFMHAVAKPLREVAITTPVSGTVSEVFIEEGSMVTQGQPLLRFDRRLSEAKIGMARAQHDASISSVKATELESRLTTTRYKNLVEAYDQNAATQVEVREAHVRMQQARARYMAASDEVKQTVENRKFAEVENELRQIVAPFDGVAVRVFAVPGQTPNINQTLIQIVDVTKLRVDLYLPLDKYEELRDREEFTLSAESPVSQDLTAKLVVLDNVIDPATQTIRCVLEVDNTSGKLPSGFRVRLK